MYCLKNKKPVKAKPTVINRDGGRRLLQKASNNNTKYKVIITSLLAAVITFFAGSISNAMGADTSENRVRKNIDDILASRDFAKKPEGKSLLEVLAEFIRDTYEWFAEKLNNILGFSDSSHQIKSMSPQTLLVLKIIGILIIIGFIVFLLWFVLRNIKLSKRIKHEEDAILLTTLSNYEEVERTALDYCSKGDYNQGLRFLFLALLIRLNQVNIIKIEKSKTNRQYLMEIRANGYGNYNIISEFTREFNECRYGRQSVSRERFEIWLEKYRLLISDLSKTA